MNDGMVIVVRVVSLAFSVLVWSGLGANLPYTELLLPKILVQPVIATE